LLCRECCAVERAHQTGTVCYSYFMLLVTIIDFEPGIAPAGAASGQR
jgi:hypothetical protein